MATVIAVFPDVIRPGRDTHYVRSPGNELKDFQTHYHLDGGAAQAIVFYYDGEVRATDAPSGAAVRRAMVYEDRPDDLNGPANE